MGKPWLEQWGYINGGLVKSRDGESDEDILASSLGRLALASAAPDMCRALLAVEWAAKLRWSLEQTCPSCGLNRLHDDGSHAVICVIDAALTTAGLPDQASRDAARKEAGI